MRGAAGKGVQATHAPPLRAQPAPALTWASMNDEDLVQVRDEITQVLDRRGRTSLLSISLETEMLLQYSSLRALQAQVIGDEEVPVNQKAQLANSITTLQGKLAEYQNEIYGSERVKAMESALRRALVGLPRDVAEKFLEDYERLCQGLSN